MTNPPPHQNLQSSIASGTNNLPGAASPTSPQSAGGFPTLLFNSRPRNLPPISTASAATPTGTAFTHTSPSHGSRQGHRSQNYSSTVSPFTSSFSSILNTSGRIPNTRLNQPQSSPQAAGQTGSQQPSEISLLSSLQSKTATVPTYSQAFSAAASTTAAQGGGGGSSGGGGGSRGSSGFSPSLSQPPNITSPTSGTFNFGSNNNPNSSSSAFNNQAGQLSRITVTQVFLLLSSLKEDQDRAKWEQQAEQIRKLVENSNDMDVFSKYFLRLLRDNSPHLFLHAGEHPSFQMLVTELHKVAQDDEQSQKIAMTIDAADGDMFRDFDLSAVMQRTGMDPLEKMVLALAFKANNRSEFRTKADAIITTNYAHFIDIMISPNSQQGAKYAQVSPPILATIIERLLLYAPPNYHDEANLTLAVRVHYQTLNLPVPMEVSSALQVGEILKPEHVLATALQAAGPQCTKSLESCAQALRSVESTMGSELQVGMALLYLVLARNFRLYKPEVFVSLVHSKSKGNGLQWRAVLQVFDRDGLRIDPERFLALYEALLPVAIDGAVDIQLLWAGQWRNEATQLSFLTSFFKLTPSTLSADTVPGLQKIITINDFEAASDSVKEYAEKALESTLVSLEAMRAVLNIAFRSRESLETLESQDFLREVVQPNMDIFLCAAFGTSDEKTETQQSVLVQLFSPFLMERQSGYELVLYYLWKQNKQWVAVRLVEAHSRQPMRLPTLLDVAEENRWTNDLFPLLNGFGIDLAALAHQRGILDLEDWSQKHAERARPEFVSLLCKFLSIKAEEEMRIIRNEQSEPRTISLGVNTVNALLLIVERYITESERQELVRVQRSCIQAYPRLFNYDGEFDAIIDANGQISNALPATADRKMQDYYKRMYGDEIQVRQIIEHLQAFKHSQDPAEQDLFACMVHGLFDEYNCYSQYPLDALATTAVLFGSIINFELLSGIPLQVGLGLILEAVRDHDSNQPMFKFGLQALLQFRGRLHEWPGFCRLLSQVPWLRGTEIANIVDAALRDQEETLSEEGINNVEAQNELSDLAGLTNGNLDGILSGEKAFQKFTSVRVDPSSRSDLFEDPSEDVQDSVLFVLNNISERNFKSKIESLKDTLQDRYHHWFAGYLVEERAKVQPNFHRLYLEMLDNFNDSLLSSEVLRETYASVIRLLNSQTIVDSIPERGHLKNLGSWLGSLTIARDTPVKQRNIAFKDLLIEAYDSQRLLAVIPFVCKVLDQASKSTVFKPPNPWLMDIIKLLVELYHFADLKLNGKFEVEVLCKDLGLDHNTIEPSTAIRDRPQLEAELIAQHLPDRLDGFDELALSGLSRQGPRNERFSPEAIVSSLPDLGPLLVYPPSSSTMISPVRLRQIVQSAIQRAIYEIISPVVERSVTIAAISAAELIHKDFATEPDEEKVKDAAIKMVKALAGSLALVTCKEPLRMSMSNYIRIMSTDLGDQALPEGAILMCVNDNLDAACGLVEQAAELRAIPEIEEQIGQLIVSRREHRLSNPSEQFVDPIFNRWSYYIPEPYKPTTGGLKKEQLAIYADFARQTRGVNASAHVNGPSVDNGRSIANETLAEQFPSVPNLPTPAEPPAIPRQQTQPQQQRVQPPPAMPAMSNQAPQMNGFADINTIRERINNHLADLQQVAREVSEQHLKDLPSDNPVSDLLGGVVRLVMASPNRDETAFAAANMVSSMLYAETDSGLSIEALAQLLQKLCHMSNITGKEVMLWLANQADERVFNVGVTVALLDTGLLELHRVDNTIAKAIESDNPAAVHFLEKLMDAILLTDRPIALRADFTASIEALSQSARDVPEEHPGKLLVQKLKASGFTNGPSAITDEHGQSRRDQIGYVFSEWIGLCQHSSSTEKSYTAFVSQMNRNKLVSNETDSSVFFRICIDIAVEAYENEEASGTGTTQDAFIYVDALAKLITFLARHRGELVQDADLGKPEYFNSMLSIIVLVLCHHHNERGDRFNQKVFFRLFSSLLCEYKSLGRQSPERAREIMMVFAKTFLMLQPYYFQGFAFGWLSLVSHRIFMPGLLNLPDQAGWPMYAQLMDALLSFVGDQLKPLTISGVAKDLYRGVLRVLLVLHHDFPEFLAENHFKLCNVIPAHCTQLRNLILSAYPSSFPELPDPFTAGLKVDRIVEIRNSPVVAGDIEGPLSQANIKDIIDFCLREGPSEENVLAIAKAVHNPHIQETGVAYTPVSVDTVLLNCMVLYIGSSAIAAASQKNAPTFAQSSTQAALMTRLVHELLPEARYYFLSAIANQLRYPNSHTHYFSYALLFLFGNDHNDQQESDVRQQITRVLLERLIVHRPHPWGLIITLLELLKNPAYMFWDLPFIKAAPEIERLFSALFSHINTPTR